MRKLLNLLFCMIRRSHHVPPPGRKMGKQEAQDYVFKEYRETLAMLADS